MDNAMKVRDSGNRTDRRATGLVTLVAAVAWTATTSMILPGLVAASETSAPTDDAASRAVPCEAADDTSLTAIDLTSDVGLVDDPCEDEPPPAVARSSEADTTSETEACKSEVVPAAYAAIAVPEVTPPFAASTSTIAARQLSMISDLLAEHAAAIAWYEERIAELEQRLDRFEEMQGRSLPVTRDAPQTAAAVSDSLAAAGKTGPIKRPVAKSLTPLGSTPAAGGLPKVTTGPVPGVTSPAAAPAPAVNREVDKGAIRTAGGDEAKLEILGLRQVDRADRSVTGPALGRTTP